MIGLLEYGTVELWVPLVLVVCLVGFGFMLGLIVREPRYAPGVKSRRSS